MRVRNRGFLVRELAENDVVSRNMKRGEQDVDRDLEGGMQE